MSINNKALLAAFAVAAVAASYVGWNKFMHTPKMESSLECSSVRDPDGKLWTHFVEKYSGAPGTSITLEGGEGPSGMFAQRTIKDNKGAMRTEPVDMTGIEALRVDDNVTGCKLLKRAIQHNQG